MPYSLNTTRILYQTSKYAPVAVVQLELDIPSGESFELGKTRIDADLHEICASSGGGPLFPLGERTPIGMYSALMLELQRYAGHSVQYSQVIEIETDHAYRVFIEYEDPATALYAGELAADLLNAILENRDSVHAESIGKLQQMLDEYVMFALARSLDPNARLLMRIARRRGVPSLSLDRQWDEPTLPGAIKQSGVIQYGWGMNQRRCAGSMPLGFTPQENLQQISDRAQLLSRLKKASIPVADQDLEFINRNQVKRAQRSARRIGYPVTLRPRAAIPAHYRFQDNQVFGPLHTDAEVALVAAHLRERAGTDIWVESYTGGTQYNFLVLNNEVLSVARCSPPELTGDGVHTIAELASLRATAEDGVLSRRVWSSMALGDGSMVCRLQLAGLSLNSVRASGKQIVLRGFGTLYNGGSCEDVTRDIPPQFCELALQVADLSGMGHLAGVEMNIGNLSGAATTPNCAVTGVDPAPDLLVHDLTSDEDPYHVGEKYLALLFPAGRPPRIPTVAVTGTNGKTTTCRMVTRILQTAGRRVGLSCTDGIYLDGELLLAGDEAGVLGAKDMLMDQRMEAVVLETARGGMANRGVGFDRCEVGACLNVAEDHLGEEGIETLDDMAVHKRQVIERAAGVAVLNANDPRCLAMREHATAREVILIAYSAGHPAIKTHCQAGEKAIALDTGEDIARIVLVTSDNKITPIMAVKDIPATVGGAAQHNVYNAMFAIGISIGLGIQLNYIITALKAFKMGVDSTPGRLNEINGFPFRVIADTAHNVHGFRSLVKFTNQLTVQGKKILNFGVSGRLSDQDIRDFSKIAAGNFDLYILKNYHMDINDILKHRSYTEVPEMLKKELIFHGVPEELIIVELDVLESLDQSLKNAVKGDLMIVLLRVAGNDKYEVIRKLEEAAHKWVKDA